MSNRIKFRHKVSESELVEYYLNLNDLKGKRYGQYFPERGSTLIVIDRKNRTFTTKMHNKSQIGHGGHAGLRKWFQENKIVIGSQILVTYDSGLREKGNPVVRLSVIQPREEKQPKPISITVPKKVVSPTLKASDISEPPLRVSSATYRILRDTNLARQIKELYKCVCQVCHAAGLDLGDGRFYAEMHHIRPLGTPHNGPDSVGKVLCVCPNCHVLLDYGAIKLEVSKLLIQPGHVLGRKFIDYHNKTIFGHIELPD